jgi:uncharacterized protein
MLNELITHPIFLTIIFASLGVQIVKVILFAIKYKSIHLLDLVATGGMPSSHSALMAGMTTIIYLTEGLTSTLFVSLALTAIVITDAMGVRRTAGEEGKLLHKIIDRVKINIKEPHYSLGHTPEQVAVGTILGIIIAIVVNSVF